MKRKVSETKYEPEPKRAKVESKIKLRDFELQDLKFLVEGGNTTNIYRREKDAIKVLPKIDTEPEHFDREVEILQILAQFCDKYIICFKDAYQDDKNYYIITELLSDGFTDMREFFQGVKLDQIQISDQDRIDIARELLHGLAYIHSIGVVHSDIKPENIMIKRESDGKWTIKYIDFGFACALKDCKFTNFGTDYYLPPEKWSLFGPEFPTKHFWKADDYWTLGLVLLELFSDYMQEFYEWKFIQAKRENKINATTRFKMFVRDMLNQEKGTILNYAPYLDENFAQEFPQVKKILDTMLVLDPNKRQFPFEFEKNLDERQKEITPSPEY